MKRTILYILSSLFLFSTSFGQTKENKALDPYLRAVLEKHAPNEELNVYLDGHLPSIRDRVIRAGGTIKMEAGGFLSIRLPSKEIRALHQEPYVKNLFIHSGKGHALNDTMREQNGITPIQRGTGLPDSLKGKDVVMGYIDTGIDLDHPDFQDSTGNTRVLYIWDQTFPDSTNTPPEYNYGQVWDSTDINSGNCPHIDQNGYYGHGSTVTGTGSGNGLSTGQHIGGAPRSDIIIVSNDLNAPNWTSTIADGVDFIVDRSAALGKPVVINTSVGTYLGSHDAKDPAARIIDSLITDTTGRALVASAGNSGSYQYHLSYPVTNDTSFTWFEYNNSSSLGYGAVFFEAWADTSDFNNVDYAIGADRVNPTYQFRGRSDFHNIKNNTGLSILDTILSPNGDTIAFVETFGQLLGDRYKLSVVLEEPDSNQYNFRFMTTGSGTFDIWSDGWLGRSHMVEAGSIPDSSQFPDIVDYQPPDNSKNIVSSWTCSPEVITVGNYVGRMTYTDVNGNIQTTSGTYGEIAGNSSHGPTRKGLTKPDVTATGKILITPGKLSFTNWLINNQPYKVHQDSMHYRNGGTSIAAPVVSSIAALYLQRCPKADNLEIADAIRNTADSDNHTGSTPNNTYGYGKANGIEALKESLYEPQLIYQDTAFCEGDSVQVSVSSSYIDPTWSTSQNSYQVQIDTSTQLWVQVENQSGCPGHSDTVTITEHSNPGTPPVFQSGDTLFTSMGPGSYQWHHAQSPIPGATDSLYIAQDTGSYFLEFTDTNGCQGWSDTLSIIPSSLEEQNEGSPWVGPNPTSGKTYLQVPDDLKGDLRTKVYDLYGKEVNNVLSNRKTGSNRILIDLTNHPDGIYLIKVRTSEKTRSFRIIKE